jgi:hypothetical protein
LAGEASTDEINGFDPAPLDFLDVAIAFHLGPMLLQNLEAVWFNLNLPSTFHPGAFKT